MYVCVYENTFEVQTPSHWNVTGSSMTATLSMLSPTSILSPPACHYAFTMRRIFRRVVKKNYYFG